MPDIWDHRDGAQPQRVNCKLQVKPGTYLQVMVLHHHSVILRPAVAALLHTTTPVRT